MVKLSEVWATKVSVPLRAPILTSYGALKVASRTVVRLTGEDGSVGWGEASAWVSPESVMALSPILVGASAWDHQAIRTRLENVNYFNKTPLMNAMVEMAMIDLAARSIGEPAWRLLGGKHRDTVAAAAYLFYEHQDVHTPYDRDNAMQAVLDRYESDCATYGYATAKLKGGVLDPAADLELLEVLRDRQAGPLRLDPQGSWSLPTSLAFCRHADRRDIPIEYLEDPCEGMPAMAELRGRSPFPLATNMCVTNWDEFGRAVAVRPVDVILADNWYWGGAVQSLALDRAARAAGFGLGMHSGLELGIGLAAMVQTTACMSNVVCAMDMMNQLLTDDILTERLAPKDGMFAISDAPGWGVEIDEDKLAQWAAFADDPQSQDRYTNAHLPDVARPGWYPVHPQW